MKILSKQLPKHPRHHHIWDSPYFYASMDFPIYLPYHKKICPNFFFWKKFGSKIPYLPTVWTYVQSFVVFLFGTLSLGDHPSDEVYVRT